jgi:ankyrin repeat protein
LYAVLRLPDPAGELCQAAADGQVAKLQVILDMGVSPNVADYDKRTPLHLAASEGRLECVKLLLSCWADVNPVDRMGGTPLMDAVRHGHSEVQHLLLKHGGLLKMDAMELGAMLCQAAATGDLKTLQTLVENGANINQGDYDSRTALHLAVCANKLEVIPYLTSLPSVDINPVDRLGNTPLDDAERENFPDIVGVLRVRGGKSGRDAILQHKVEAYMHLKEERHLAKLARREATLAGGKMRATVSGDNDQYFVACDVS